SEPIPVRNKTSTRPWQHVLEPLGAYLTLAAALTGSGGFQAAKKNRTALRSAFNFGPDPESNRTVEEVVREILKHWPGKWDDKSDSNAPHEAGRLNLTIDKALHLLDWSPVWNFEKTIAQTIAWYRDAQKANAREINQLTLEQINQYEADWNDRSKRN